jgi:NAD(P)-dependent dehydrogenase (short-subunit alcohol dehydrogenase family)
MSTILITGAAGYIGGVLRRRLTGHRLRLTDVDAEEGVAALDVTDRAAVEAACRGADAVVHLGGIASEDAFDAVLEANVRGTQRVLEGARRAGVPTVVLASSNHAVGLVPRSAAGPDGLPDDAPARPDSFYGWSKAAIEALGRLYHDRYGLNVTCLRIGDCSDEPAAARDLAVWLSPDDAARLVEAAITATGWHVVWGVSANSRRWWSTAGGRAIGYRPRDDAERWAPRIGDDLPPPDRDPVGGGMARKPLGDG